MVEAGILKKEGKLRGSYYKLQLIVKIGCSLLDELLNGAPILQDGKMIKKGMEERSPGRTACERLRSFHFPLFSAVSVI